MLRIIIEGKTPSFGTPERLSPNDADHEWR
jgi:hypothetical protein